MHHPSFHLLLFLFFLFNDLSFIIIVDHGYQIYLGTNIVLEVQNFKNEKDEQTKMYLFILFYIFGRQSQRQIGYEKYEV